jgi:ribose/xylose/arabinose/galactoside ABC-type transport system permease subunit
MVEMLDKRVNKELTIKTIFSRYGIYIAFIVIFIILGVLSDNFLSFNNIMNVIRQVSFNGILALGMTFVIITGGIDLTVGSTLALAGLVATSFSVADNNPKPLIVALLIGLGVATIIGLINGVLVAKFKVAPFIATLATMTIVRGTCLVYCDGRPIINPTKEFSVIGQGYIGKISIPVIIFIVLIVLCIYLLHFSRFGRHVIAVGGNEIAAKASGLNIGKIKILVYTLSGLLAGIVGITLASRANAASPISGEGYELNAIAASVIGGVSMSGGVGTIIGTVVGAMIIGVISNGLDLLNVSSYYQQIIKGIIILVAVLMDRKGKQ